ncbi:Putative hexokinase [Komagataella phaffii CBS 7435]|uniref:Phosphotransferase n=2 Tax=Komagataella phaffii TaxID=460519 RepID=C4QYH5_KOMPG|nr:Hexokinase isoenzyme 2 that catalyzes phosphorylation of glucose in the cytosol [Komagataella phaffii GS115]AOA61341.1 GQ67_01710T0 [Komagataella phaffii]CAH2447121.1 Putative hexokinase [Komagataella phaffii CBS 7435]AOA66400.1 GQ68_01725T0 [Komagataella phaffii GS115]CAY68298.1 Hexokinase isoenzyme 2 that catalyzes phosphorylation of glucose in the cytosol [Komagataella phaffii GS115]CCA37366.1 Putative hexokinase [Komagataella phaffii CBS 7435]
MVPVLTPQFHSSPSVSDFTAFINRSNVVSITSNLYESYKEAIHSSNVSMYCTNSSTPTGNECGTCLVVELGGSTLRIAVLRLEKRKYENLYQRDWTLTESDKVIDLKFFDEIAQKITNIPSLRSHFRNDTIRIGISWSFPLEQTSSSQAVLQTMGKGFRLSESTHGQDLKTLFENSLKSNGIDASVESIINDSVAVFVAGNYLESCVTGLVAGTGVNCALVVDRKMIGLQKSQEQIRPLRKGNFDKVVLNSELGFFGGFLCQHSTIWDKMVHENWALHHSVQTNQPHMTLALGCFQPIEMMCSGRYIGELTRLAILSLIDSKQLFKGSRQNIPSAFNVPYSLGGAIVSEIYESEGHLPELWAPLAPSQEDYQILFKVVDSIIERASVVLGCAIIALLKLSESSATIDPTGSGSCRPYRIGYVGSVLKCFKPYREKVEMVLNLASKLQIINRPASLIYIDDSNLVGAAVSVFTPE